MSSLKLLLDNTEKWLLDKNIKQNLKREIWLPLNDFRLMNPNSESGEV